MTIEVDRALILPLSVDEEFTHDLARGRHRPLTTALLGLNAHLLLRAQRIRALEAGCNERDARITDLLAQNHALEEKLRATLTQTTEGR
jgi:hypothetical protein